MTRLLWFLLFLLCTSIVSDAAKDVKCADDLINLFAQTPLDYVEDVSGLAPYFSNKYILSNARNRKQALSRTTRVDEPLGVVISKADTVEVVVNPGGEVTEEEVRDALNDLVHGKGDTPMDVDVVPRGDGSYIVSIVVPADDTDSVVKALEGCL